MARLLSVAFALLASCTLLTAQTGEPDVKKVRPLKAGAQPPSGSVAVIEGKVVTRKEFVDALFERFRNHNAGRQALENLVERKVIDRHLAQRKLTVTTEEIDALYARYDADIREKTGGAKGMEFFLEQRGMSKVEFRRLLRTYCALQKLASQDFEKETTTQVEQKQWLKSKRKEARVSFDDPEMPADAAARIYDGFITREEFAGTVLRILESNETVKIAEAIMQAKLALMLCADADVTIEPKDIDAVYTTMAADFESDPRYEGLTFARFVEERFGMKPTEHKKSANFLREVALNRLGEKLVSAERTQALYEEKKEHFGPIYELRHIVIRGSDDPKMSGKLRSLDAAKQVAEDVKGRIDSGKLTFEEAATMFSEDARSKFKKGIWDSFTPARLKTIEGGESIVSLREEGVTAPLRFPAGYRIVKLAGKKPAPPLSPKTARELRKHAAREIFNRAWRDARKGHDLTTLLN